MFFKIIDKYTVEKAPNPLKIDGKDVFTNSEETHNSLDYFKVVETEYPKDDKAYRPIYTLGENAILREWEELVVNEVEEEL